MVSHNTPRGQVHGPFVGPGGAFFDSTWQFGTAHLVHREGRWFLYMPMPQIIAETDFAQIRHVVGPDYGVNFLCDLRFFGPGPPFSPTAP